MLNAKILCAALLCLSGAGAAFCQAGPNPPPNVFHDYKYDFFALPKGAGSLTTINNHDVVAGSYYPTTPSDRPQGYLRYPDGKVVLFTVPNASSFNITELNDRDEAVGIYTDKTTGNNTGFVRHADGKIETFALDGATGQTNATGINNEGNVYGVLFDNNNSDPDRPFLRYPDGQYLTFSIGVDAQTIFTQNINDQGVALGVYFCPDSEGSVCGFYGKPGGKITTFSYPPNGIDTFEINNRGDIAGVAFTASGQQDYFIRKPDGKMILAGLSKAPDSIDDSIVSINDEGELVGAYSVFYNGPPPVGGTSYRYDIIRSTDGKISYYDPPQSPGMLQGVKINDRGVIAGRVIGGFGGTNGLFLLTPKRCDWN